MPSPDLNHVDCQGPAGAHRMAYWQWGSPSAAHVIVCVHGLSRQGRDFDVLAQALLAAAGPQGLRVVCPDVVGRGHSDWLADPAGYQVPTYAGDMLQLLAQLHRQAPIGTLDWVGTSMGGLIGMAVCGSPELPLPAPVRKLVLNDVGPAIARQALERISTYVGQNMRFASMGEAVEALAAASASFGPHTPQQWLALSEPMLRPDPEGGVRLHYDPAIASAVRAIDDEAARAGEAMLWQLYDRIRADTLLLRGAESDLLAPQTAQAMTERGPRARLIEFAGVGHAPTLVTPQQVQPVVAFLLPGVSEHEDPGR